MMKKTLMVCCFALIFWSCEDDFDALTQNEEQQSVNLKPADISNPVVQKLMESGTDYDDILEGPNFFYVEDYLFQKDIGAYEFLEPTEEILKGGGRSEQYREGSIVSLFNLRVRVFLHPDLRAEYLNPLQDVIADYNGLNNCGLRFEYSTVRNASNIVIDPQFSNEDFLGRAEFPSKLKVGRQIFINTRFNNNNFDARYEILLHEIGHCIGLRHTNWESNGEGSYGSFWDFFGIRPDEPVHIPGTPADESDTNSFMWSALRLGFIGFTNDDETAIQTIYPRALRTREVLADQDFDFGTGEYFIETDVFVDVFEDASYTTPTTVGDAITTTVFKITQEFNAGSGMSIRPITRTLGTGTSTRFLTSLEEQCTPAQGEICTEEYISTIQLQ